MAFIAYKLYVNSTSSKPHPGKTIDPLGQTLTVDEAINIAAEGLGINIVCFSKGHCRQVMCHRSPFPVPIKIHLAMGAGGECSILYKASDLGKLAGASQLYQNEKLVLSLLEKHHWSYYTICDELVRKAKERTDMVEKKKVEREQQEILNKKAQAEISRLENDQRDCKAKIKEGQANLERSLVLMDKINGVKAHLVET